jgi:nitrite reductase/ring-hydroxylating ferredoxin subunit/uncharacterized membrane protein
VSVRALVSAVDRPDWIEKGAQALQDGVHQAYDALGSARQPVMDVFHGTWIGHPLHPILTDVTIGMWMATAVLDVLGSVTGDRGLDTCARATITAGLASSAITATAGITDWMHLQDHPRRVGFVHALLNASSLALYGASLMMRRRGKRAAGRNAAMAGLMVASTAAYLGSELVYGLRVGSDHTSGYALPEDWVAVLPEGDLIEGEPRRITANGVPVVLVRRGRETYALVATCAHLGGPLDKGHLDDGSMGTGRAGSSSQAAGLAIVCPWHRSRYALGDGRLERGPSVYWQPALDVRVREGQIEVRGAPRPPSRPEWEPEHEVRARKR